MKNHCICEKVEPLHPAPRLSLGKLGKLGKKGKKGNICKFFNIPKHIGEGVNL